MFRCITGHAFMGECTAYFLGKKFPLLLPEGLIACRCRELPKTVEHILLECPNYKAARHKNINTQGRTQSLDQLFDTLLHCAGTLQFLKEMKACVRPRNWNWNPG
jgi:hypothetical protein